MKKTILKGLVLAGVLMLAAAPAMAADAKGAWQGGTGVTISDTGGGGDINATLSPNVKVYYKGNATTGSLGANYAATSYNTKGTKEYGVASDYQGIMFKDIVGTDGVLAPVDPSAPSAGSFSGWNEVGK